MSSIDAPSVRFVERHDDPGMAGFVSLYIAAFGGPPYFEPFTHEQVVDGVWHPHIPHCIILAECDGLVVGLGCAVGLVSPESPVRDFISGLAPGSLPFPPEQTLYMSELAVHESYRKHGIGQRIIEERMRWGKLMGYTHYCMRTAKDGSNSRRLYERMGAQIAPFEQDVSDGEVKTESKFRIYLYGKI